MIAEAAYIQTVVLVSDSGARMPWVVIQLFHDGEGLVVGLLCEFAHPILYTHRTNDTILLLQLYFCMLGIKEMIDEHYY